MPADNELPQPPSETLERAKTPSAPQTGARDTPNTTAPAEIRKPARDGDAVDCRGSSGDRVVIPRAEHPISRKNIADEALRVLQRLNQNGFQAYLVGGAVRDLYLGKTPKDYDIATDARPSRLKKLFRNCRIIGRRFRIAHVYFANGQVLEVSTFRRSVSDVEKSQEAERSGSQPPDRKSLTEPAPEASREDRHTGDDGRKDQRSDRRDDRARRDQRDRDQRQAGGIVRAKSGIILRDNAYGSPEEDARRRDLTINGLFYDIGTFSVLDYVGGVRDLMDGVVRMISDPDQSFREDPVRMIRALRHAARTDFRIEEQTLEAIYRNRKDIVQANPSRLLEEMLKDLRSGMSVPFFTSLVQTHVLDNLLPVLATQLRQAGPDHPFWRRAGALDRRMAAGSECTTPVLLTVMLYTSLFADPELWEGNAPNPPDVWKHVSTRLRQSTTAMRISRRDTERILQIIIAFRKLHRDLERGRMGKSLVHKVYLLESLQFLILDLESLGESTALAEKWYAQAVANANRDEADRESGDVRDPATTDQQDSATRQRKRSRRRRSRGRKSPES